MPVADGLLPAANRDPDHLERDASNHSSNSSESFLKIETLHVDRKESAPPAIKKPGLVENQRRVGDGSRPGSG